MIAANMVFTFFVGGKHYPEAPWLCAWFELKVLD